MHLFNGAHHRSGVNPGMMKNLFRPFMNRAKEGAPQGQQLISCLRSDFFLPVGPPSSILHPIDMHRESLYSFLYTSTIWLLSMISCKPEPKKILEVIRETQKIKIRRVLFLHSPQCNADGRCCQAVATVCPPRWDVIWKTGTLVWFPAASPGVLTPVCTWAQVKHVS